MARPPVAIFIGGRQLNGYTGMTMRRSKDDLTGTLDVDLFFNYMPDRPVIVQAVAGAPISLYIGGNLAFTGKLDGRRGIGNGEQPRDARGRFVRSSGSSDGGGSISSGSIGPDSYTVKLSARGMTKYLVESSHQEKKTTIKKPTSRQAFEKILKPFNIRLDFQGTEIEVDKIRLRDGAKVIDEVRRLCEEYSYYAYETRDGKLRIIDGSGSQQGEALILGQNILTFSAQQSEEQARSEITVKGQRTPKDVWGEQAVLPPVATITDDWVQSYMPVVLQHYGDGTKEALERRGRFEANKRSSKSKTLTIEVFHVQPRSGDAWDIGTLHYCEVPPEGIADVFECTEINYTVTNNDKLSTTLTLSPPSASSGPSQGLGAYAGELSGLVQQGASRLAALGVSFAAGQFPQMWSGPVLSTASSQLVDTLSQAVSGLVQYSGQNEVPPMTLPKEFDV